MNRLQADSILQKIRARSVRTDSGCLLWQGAKSGSGYGSLSIGGRITSAHRAAWEAAKGPIGDRAMFVLHRCDVRLCVEIDHLFLGTNADNVSDMMRKGRQAFGKNNGSHTRPERRARVFGERNYNAKLSDSQVRAIFHSYWDDGVSMRVLAADHGVSGSAIKKIVSRKTWAHLNCAAATQSTLEDHRADEEQETGGETEERAAHGAARVRGPLAERRAPAKDALLVRLGDV